MGERGWSIRWMWGLIASVSLLLGQARAAALPELNVGQQQLLQATGEEKPYNVRIHFLKSNERRHDLFFSTLNRLGGGYLGVGSDQNYTLAAVAQAELLFLVDIDAEVIRWHKVYAALIPIAETPQALLKLMHPRAEAAVRSALQARWGSEAAELLQSYRNYRHMIGVHLAREQQVSHNGRAATWMSDPVLYGRIRDDLPPSHRPGGRSARRTHADQPRSSRPCAQRHNANDLLIQCRAVVPLLTAVSAQPGSASA